VKHGWIVRSAGAVLGTITGQGILEALGVALPAASWMFFVAGVIVAEFIGRDRR
jgi:hypothetical protein